MTTSTSYNTLQAVLQTYHDNYAIPMLRLVNEMQRDRTPESVMAAIKAQDLAQAMLSHIGDVASRIAAMEHSTLTQEEADIISGKSLMPCCCYSSALRRRAKWRSNWHRTTTTRNVPILGMFLY